ncbi:MAG: LysR family transcriptional regulator [Gammaproteobacteria bacterium]|nr:LysR family transcriptional regulator [Gammaproteobacteria bacterium]
MNRVELSRINLNQLVALQVLLSTVSVSLAAKQLFVTQSAMSKTLANLRELFDDQLLIRVGTKMQLTPLAQQMARELPKLLQSIEDFVDLRTFDPTTADLEIRMAVLSYLGQQLMPEFMARIQAFAPGIKVIAEGVTDNSWRRLEQGELDMVLAFPPRVGARPTSGEALGPVPFTTLVKEGHPLTQGDVTMDAFLSFPHVRYLVPAMTRYTGGLVDEWLADQNLRRRVIYDTPDVGSIVEIMRRTDCVYSGVDLRLLPGANLNDIVSVGMPEGLTVAELKFWMYMAPDRKYSAEMQWLSDTLKATYADMLFNQAAAQPAASHPGPSSD